MYTFREWDVAALIQSLPDSRNRKCAGAAWVASFKCHLWHGNHGTDTKTKTKVEHARMIVNMAVRPCDEKIGQQLENQRY
jgi:hypothetical protein